MIQYITILLTCLFLLFGSAQAQESGPLGFGPPGFSQDMETDRPDFTEGAQTITPGHLQLEGGYLFTYNDDSDGRFSEHGAPQGLLRLGLGSDLELRLGWEGLLFTEERVGGQTVRIEGAADTNIGIKHRMYSQHGPLPDFSFILQLGLPTGADRYSSDDVDAELKLIWAYEITDSIGLAGNVNFAAPVENKERFFEASSSVTVAKDLCEVLGVYLEYYGFYPNEDAPDSTSTHYVNGGFTYAVSSSFQLDILMGMGLNSEADDLFGGVGFAYRQ